jgi:hypothetical protein
LITIYFQFIQIVEHDISDDKILSERRILRSCSGDADLVVIGQRMSTELLKDESWEEEPFVPPSDKPVFSIQVAETKYSTLFSRTKRSSNAL